MKITHNMFSGPYRPMKLIDHRIGSREAGEINAVLFEYLMAGNGVIIRAERNEFAASLPVYCGPISGLPKTKMGVFWKKPRIGPWLWQDIIDDARSTGASGGFREEVYIIYWDPAWPGWRWRAIGRERSRSSTIADDTVPEYRDACIELHTHPPGAFHFSRADDLDEAGKFRIFGILADVHDIPKVRFRCGIYDNFFPIPAAWAGDLPRGLIDLTEIDLVFSELLS